ncbi:MAG: tryptophan--tRNA ligase, partial [Muribaculaceae bacterium]|nr:tryptophan--tRNA ligase [Muribaculaceae bacterium]
LHLNISDPGHLEGNTPFIYLDAFCRPEHFAKYLPEYESLDALKEHYTRGGLGDGTVKKFLINILDEELTPLRERRAYYEKNIPAVYDILKEGSRKAREAAARTLEEVRAAMKINYFDDPALIAEQAAKYAGK